MVDDAETIAQDGMKKRTIIIAMAAVCAIIVAAILLPLLLTTESGRTPEETVTAYLNASFSRDIESLLEITNPGQLKGLEEAWGEDYKDDIREALQPSTDVPVSLSCTDMRYKTELYGENALVEIAGGRLVAKQDSGVETVENLIIEDKLGLIGSRFTLRKILGNWYIDVFREPHEIVIYLSDLTTEEDRAAIESFLLSIPEVDPTSLYYKSKDEALEEFKSRLQGTNLWDEKWDELTENPLPNSFEVIPRKGASIERIVEQIESNALYKYCIEEVDILILRNLINSNSY